MTVPTTLASRARRWLDRLRPGLPAEPNRPPTLAAPPGESADERLDRYAQLARLEYQRKFKTTPWFETTVTSRTRLAAIVAAARVLDRVEPGWHRRVDVQRLCLAETADCVLGQLYGNYEAGEVIVCDRHRAPHEAFFGGSSDDVWRAEIELRRAAEAAEAVEVPA